MASKRHRDFPILDKDGCYLGMISRRNLLGARGKQVILVDHNEKNQAVAPKTRPLSFHSGRALKAAKV